MNILLIGEHPQGVSGNSHMMAAIIHQIDLDKHNVAVFASGTFKSAQIQMDQRVQVFEALEFEQGEGGRYDAWGSNKLLNTLSVNLLDLVVFVGIDIWRYAHIYKQINPIRARKRFRLGAIFPYDLPNLRNDWLEWINFFDYPMVYSKFGYDLLKPHISKIRYYRPMLFDAEHFRPFPPEGKLHCRRTFFPSVPDDYLIFGFVGRNQFRKDPQRLIKAFMEAKKQYPKMTLYLHSDLVGGVFNLQQIMSDYGGKTGDFIVKPQTVFDTSKMVALYNAMDCLINCTLNEGLSWTVIEAQLCGVPQIVSDSTAQTELVKDGGGILVPCKELSYLPVVTSSGQGWVETNACSVAAMVAAILAMARSQEMRDTLSTKAVEIGRAWVAGASNFERAFLTEGKRAVKKEILFIQHSAAGDVLMTTKALAGIKKRHGGLPLVYMTQKKYHDILVGNPNIDRIIDFNYADMAEYEVVYSPHAERILPGHWGRNSNSLLSDFYWKILEVEKGDFSIQRIAPAPGLIARTPLSLTSRKSKPIAVLHTTGGDPKFRTYQYMGDVAMGLKKKGYYTVQLGAKDDYPAEAELDLRGVLSFREAAWVMDKAQIAVTVDSFMSHLAGALGVSQVCLFGSGNHFVVKPEQVSGKLVCLAPDYIRYCPGLGPCSGSVRDCPHTCTGMHDPKTILDEIEKIEREGWNREGWNEQIDNSEQYVERNRSASAMV